MSHKLHWEKRGDGWRTSWGWGAHSVRYSRQSKTWYAFKDNWIGDPTLLGHSRTRAGAQAIIQAIHDRDVAEGRVRSYNSPGA